MQRNRAKTHTRPVPSSSATQSRDTILRPIPRADSACRCFAQIHATAQAGDPARKVFDDCTSLVMDSKRQMINSLYAICSLRDDYRLSLVMYSFRQSVERLVPLVKQVCTQWCSQGWGEGRGRGQFPPHGP